jgi:ribosome-associated protein
MFCMMKKPHHTVDDDFVSKSQLKREAKALFMLGKQLSELPESILLSLPLERDILDEILFARSIKSHVARKRQLGFVAKRLRITDVEPIQAALGQREDAARELNSRHHRTEAWRDALLAQGDVLLTDLLAGRQDADVQALRQLIRNARREAEKNKPPTNARKLFRMLRDLDEANPLPPLD